MSISLDPVAHTLSYEDLSNGDSDTVSYGINPDGIYAFTDPRGNFSLAYETPGVGLVIAAERTGSSHDLPSLVFALPTASITVESWAGRGYNTMIFRAGAGGVEVGSISFDSGTNARLTSYWPYGALDSNALAFHESGFSASGFQMDGSNHFIRVPDSAAPHYPFDGMVIYDYLFGSQSGVFAIDRPDGSLLGVRKAPLKDFDPKSVGGYRGIYLQKLGAGPGEFNSETGTASFEVANLSVGGDGRFSLSSREGNSVLSGNMVPLVDAPYLHGGHKPEDPCYGTFTFRTIAQDSRQDVFVIFSGHLVLFSAFKTFLGPLSSETYEYLYGVGLRP